jgi:cardiolipin synthase A/B
MTKAHRAPAPRMLIAEVYPNGHAGDGTDQYIRLHNPATAAVDLRGWSVGDGKVRATFPAGVHAGPHQSLYIARTAAGFRTIMGALPACVWGSRGTPEAPGMNGGASFVLGATAGAVVLRDAAGAPVDTVVWGEAVPPGVTGWKGRPAPAPPKGVVLDRARAEAGWLETGPAPYAPDTDTAADWKQGSEWMDLRVLRPGQTWFGLPTFRVADLTVYASPDATYAVLTGLIDRARRSIDITMYDFYLVSVAEKLAEAVQRGVAVRVLIEADSAQRIANQERYVARVVAAAGGQVRWILDDPGRGYPGRYVYNHAKYVLVDGELTLVQSENLSASGTPADPTAGNRGWGALARNPALTAYMAQVFEADWSPAHGDVVAFEEGTPFGGPDADFVPNTEVPAGTYRHPFGPLVVQEPVTVTPVLAPDHSLLQTQGVIGLMRSARESLLIEQQYIHLWWGPLIGNMADNPDLYLAEAIAAARRGVRVRILLSDAYLNPNDPKDNTKTVRYLNQLARQENLDLQARIFRSDVAALEKIHNKGIIVDSQRAFVSSINWSQNSPMNNREVGLILEHPDVGAYYTRIFTVVMERTQKSIVSIGQKYCTRRHLMAG